MNTTAASLSSSLSSDHSWLAPCSRRNSSRRSLGALPHYVLASESPMNSDDDSDSVLSIQAKETDFVQDTSDTDTYEASEDEEGTGGMEYEPTTEPEGSPPPLQSSDDTCGDSDSNIISTRLISVGEVDEGEMEFADSEQSEAASDPELGPSDYWRCAQCRSRNNNPLYRYCEKCFKVRQNFFPPRPKRKSSTKFNSNPTKNEPISEVTATFFANLSNSAGPSSQSSIDSGVDSCFNSQELAQSQELSTPDSSEVRAASRSPDSADASQPGVSVQPIKKTISDPFVTVESLASPKGEVAQSVSESESSGRRRPISKKAIMNSLKEKLERSDDKLCIVCCSEPKSGVFVHGRIAHICCCYRCAVKVWLKAKRCPVCNCKVSNVLKAVVM